MATRSKGTPAAKRKRKPGSDVRSLLRELTARVTEAVESSRYFGAVVEDMRAQNRATIEAVQGLREEFQRDRAENRERFDRLENAVLKLSSDVVVLKSDVAALKTDVAGLKSDVAVLKADVAVLKSDVAELKSDVAVLKADVAVLKTDVAGLKSDVTVLKSDVAELKSDVTVLKADSQSLKASLARVEEKVDGKADIAALRAVEARVSALESCAQSA